MRPIWEGRRVIVCVGTGGVGKTTTSAAIGLAAARAGLRTLVMTIDPARRLANAMGLPEFGNIEREIPADLVAAHGVELAAPLWAMMPDTKRTFDALIQQVAPDRERQRRIFQNRLYQEFSTVLHGTLEFAAVEKLYEVYTDHRYDLIVLDTPPSRNAIDFLEAPARLTEFLEHDTWQWLLKPYAIAGKLSLKLFDLGDSFILRTLGKMAGAETIKELAEFIFAFQGMYDDFRVRSRRVRELLVSEDLAFALVTSTQPNQLAAAQAFREGLHREGMRVRSVVVNRVRNHPLAGASEELMHQRLAPLLAGAEEGMRDGILRAIAQEVALADLAEAAVKRLRERFQISPLIVLPELPLDAHDIDSLVALHTAFFAGPTAG